MTFLPSPTVLNLEPVPSEAHIRLPVEFVVIKWGLYSLSSLSSREGLHRKKELLHVAHPDLGVAHRGREAGEVMREGGEVAGFGGG